MSDAPFFLDLPLPKALVRLFREGGLAFDLSLEDRRRCGLILEAYFADPRDGGEPHPWFMPVIFGGVTFNRTPFWAVMLAMGIYGYLAEDSPAPRVYGPNTLGLGYHALTVPEAEPFRLVKDQRRLRVTDAFLRLDHKVDPALWVDYYGLVPLKPDVRVIPFTLIPAADLSGCVAGAVLAVQEPLAFLNPLKETFLPAEVDRFFREEPSATRLYAHRERLFDIARSPDGGWAEAGLDVGIALIRRGLASPLF